ncbi:hypothetical protein [Actinomadura rugatobispora]|uniref:Uncharacterized protein n=1 Tax=Actinomadura rugatobispora TaxID=1994 RepID=A0ABW1AFW3_9ACTN|nr:hypothetical protein GCM10010200_105160 [Actinomadura rugatobispora]
MRVATVRARTVTAATLTVAAFAPGVALAPAARSDDLDIAPATVRAGRSVTVSGACQIDDRRVTVSGAARGTGKVSDGWFSVRARIVRDRAGGYRIKTTCFGSGFTQEGLVSVTAPVRRKPFEPREPRGWAKTGGGGAQPDRLGWTLTGLALLACAGGVGAMALMRSRAAHGRP